MISNKSAGDDESTMALEPMGAEGISGPTKCTSVHQIILRKNLLQTHYSYLTKPYKTDNSLTDPEGSTGMHPHPSPPARGPSSFIFVTILPKKHTRRSSVPLPPPGRFPPCPWEILGLPLGMLQKIIEQLLPLLTIICCWK